MKSNPVIGGFIIVSIIFILILVIANIDQPIDEKVIHTSPSPISITEYSYVDKSYNASNSDGSFGAGGGHGVCTSSYVSCAMGTCHVKVKRWCDNETLELERMQSGFYK